LGFLRKKNHFEKPQRGDLNIAWGSAPGNPSYDHVENNRYPRITTLPNSRGSAKLKFGRLRVRRLQADYKRAFSVLRYGIDDLAPYLNFLGSTMFNGALTHFWDFYHNSMKSLTKKNGHWFKKTFLNSGSLI
jgi:hypothetical protein